MLNARTIQLAPDGPYFPAKTPAPSTKNLRENVYQGAMTVQNGKAKNVNLLRTPFQPKSAQPQRLSKDFPLKAPPIQLVVAPQPKPLADKTPFVNRVLNDYKTPGSINQPLKPLNLGTTTALEVPPNTNPTPGSTRASSTRKHARLPKPQAYHDFQTPANIGNHWDISDGDIVIPEEMDESEKEVEAELLDFNDEIEYMAPNTLNLEYQPPFDFELPNYKLLGQDTLHKVYSYPEEQTVLSPPSFEFTFADEEFMKWDNLSLPSLSPSDDDSGTRSHHNLKQNQVTRTSSSATAKKPAGSKRSVSVMGLRSKTTTPASTRKATHMSSSGTTKTPTCSNRSISAMNLRSKTTTPAYTRPRRPASSISLKPPPNSTIGAAQPKTRTRGTTPATTTNATSASSRMVRKPTTTSGISTKTKPTQPTTTLANTKVPTSAKRGIHSISNILRPGSTAKSIRPASAIGANDTTRRAINTATVKRPSTSTSVMRPRLQPLTTTTAAAAMTRRSSCTSVQRGIKSSLRTTRAPTTTTALDSKVGKKPSTKSTGAVTCKTRAKGRTTSVSMIKGKTLLSDDTAKKGINGTSSQDPVDAGVVPENTMKAKEKMDKDVVIPQFPVIVDVVSLDRAEIKLKEDNNDRGDDSDEDDDGDEYDDDEETVRLIIPTKKPETQDGGYNNQHENGNVIVDNIIYQGEQFGVGQGEESNLSTVEEVTEVSISVDIIEKMGVLKLE